MYWDAFSLVWVSLYRLWKWALHSLSFSHAFFNFNVCISEVLRPSRRGYCFFFFKISFYDESALVAWLCIGSVSFCVVSKYSVHTLKPRTRKTMLDGVVTQTYVFSILKKYLLPWLLCNVFLSLEKSTTRYCAPLGLCMRCNSQTIGNGNFHSH